MTIDPADCACLADLAPPFGLLNFFDLQRFLADFSAGDPRADINRDGVLDIHDALTFLDAYAAGCP